MIIIEPVIYTDKELQNMSENDIKKLMGSGMYRGDEWKRIYSVYMNKYFKNPYRK